MCQISFLFWFIGVSYIFFLFIFIQLDFNTEIKYKEIFKELGHNQHRTEPTFVKASATITSEIEETCIRAIP